MFERQKKYRLRGAGTSNWQYYQFLVRTTLLATIAIELSFFGFAAFRAALRLVLQTFLGVEFLFAFGEHKFLVAVFADQVFVWHGYLLCFFGRTDIRFEGSQKTPETGSGNVNRFLLSILFQVAYLSIDIFQGICIMLHNAEDRFPQNRISRLFPADVIKP